MKGLELDHISLLVRDLAASARFYAEVLGLNEVGHGGTSGKTRWFALSGPDTIHLTEGDAESVRVRKEVHVALRTASFDAVVADFAAKGIAFADWAGVASAIGYHPAGFRQIYIQDPDGYWIELNDHAA